MSLYLFKREADGPMPECWIELERIYEELEVSFDRLQVIYRPLPVTMVRSPLGARYRTPAIMALLVQWEGTDARP